ncbi:MAG: hypothetical protein PHS88_10965 [Candidatus Omnitrophica bacterium]|nr:hypothetical protein [Candidatus Omnitrophota bacterium]
MKLFAVVCFLVVSSAFFLSNSARADELDIIYSFYNGLADVIEQNRDNPDQCVAKSEEFIKGKVQSISEAAARAKQAASQKAASEEDVKRMMNEPPPLVAGGPQMNAIQRFSLVFGLFAQKYPQQASEISQVVQKYVAQQQAESAGQR